MIDFQEQSLTVVQHCLAVFFTVTCDIVIPLGIMMAASRINQSVMIIILFILPGGIE